MSKDTHIVFATPGIVLRDRALLSSANTVILDEFHERSLETDLLLALLPKQNLMGRIFGRGELAGDGIEIIGDVSERGETRATSLCDLLQNPSAAGRTQENVLAGTIVVAPEDRGQLGGASAAITDERLGIVVHRARSVARTRSSAPRTHSTRVSIAARTRSPWLAKVAGCSQARSPIPVTRCAGLAPRSSSSARSPSASRAESLS